MLSAEFPPDLGGLSYYLYNLSQELLKRGHRVTVITRGTWRKSYRDRIDGIPVYRVRFIPSPPDVFALHGFFVNRLFRTLESNFDLVHLHGAIVPPIHTSLPTVYTAHGTINKDIGNMPVKSPYFLVVRLLLRQLFKAEKRLLNWADVITAVSQASADEIKRYHESSKKAFVITPGVDPDYFIPSRTKDRDDTYILYTGRLETRKGVVDLVESAKYVRQKYPDIKFVLSGKGTIDKYLNRLVHSLGLEPNFHFTGYVDRQALLKYYQGATIYVLPSYYEGLPTSLLEAMSCGIPAVATAVEGNSEVITDRENGLLVPPRDPGKLAGAILKLLDDEGLRNQLALNARKCIEDNYGWGTIAEKMEEVYKLATS